MESQKRLIDANALVDEYIKLQYSDQTMGIACNRYASEIARVGRQPTVDAVEVVRCFECRKEGTEECPMVCKDSIFRILYAETRPDDFCSYGERKPKEDGDAGCGQAEK